MSLQYIGISHFPVLHRQFSSPTSTIFAEPSPTPSQDLTQDNKDVLIERLNDLVVRLSKDSSVEDGVVSAIHTGVDRIELLLKNREKGAHKKSPSPGSDTFWGPITPTRNVRMRFPESPSSRYSLTREASFANSEFNGREQLPGSPTSHRQSITHEATMSAERAIEIAKSAEDLASKLSATVAELQVRREESDVSFTNIQSFSPSKGSKSKSEDHSNRSSHLSDSKWAVVSRFLTNISQHIHDLLITRAEKAAERILVLEYRVKEM